MLDLNLNGKVAIVAGGDRLLSRVTAERLLREGAKVAMDAPLLHSYGGLLKKERAPVAKGALAVEVDIGKPDDCDALIAETEKAYGGLDILINLVGLQSSYGPWDLNDQAWQADLDAKIMTTMRLCRAAIPVMKDRKGGAIINTLVPSIEVPSTDAFPTTVTHAAGTDLVKVLARVNAADQIRVNAICVAMIRDPDFGGHGGPNRAAVEGKRVPLGRMGELEDLTDLVAFLASDRATYITGSLINLDGGLSALT